MRTINAMILRFINMRENSTRGGCLMFALFFLAAIFLMLVCGIATGDMKASMFIAGAIAVIAVVLGLWVFIANIRER
jgi:Na+/melibiose symporter-like transporter